MVAVEPDAVLEEERRAAVDQSHQDRRDENDRRRHGEQKAGDEHVERPLDDPVAVQEQIVRVFDAHDGAEIANLQTFNGKIFIFTQQHDMAKVPLQSIDNRPILDMVRFEECHADALRGQIRGMFETAKNGHAFDLIVATSAGPRRARPSHGTRGSRLVECSGWLSPPAGRSR